MATDFENISNLSNGKSDYTYKDIKKQCIIRGIEFNTVISSDVLGLSNWLLKNQTKEVDDELLVKFDDWLDAKLIEEGKQYLVHPGLRLSHIGDSNNDLPIIPKGTIKTISSTKKIKKEKDKFGLYKGTKKQYTFELQRKGKTIDQVITKVCRKFPDAKIKSIKIWFNRSRKDNG